MEAPEHVWTISEFSELLNRHYKKETGEEFTAHRNTIEKWFKELESQRVHYINRKNGRRMYDSLDLQLGLTVMEMRSKGVKMEVIGEAIPTRMEVRNFPDDYVEGNDKNELSIELVEKQFEEYFEEYKAKMNGILEKMNEAKGDIVQEVLKKIGTEKIITMDDVESFFKKALPEPKSEADKKMEQEALMEEMLQYRLNKEEEALAEWSKLPKEERTIKVGLFGRRIEDLEERDKFIRKFLQGKKEATPVKTSEETH